MPELATTHLNLCTIHSQLTQHQEAISHAVKSVLIIKTYLKSLCGGSGSGGKSTTEENASYLPPAKDTLPGTEEDRATIMGTFCAAYFNLAVSFENVKKYSLAKQAYERSLAVCTEHMPTNQQLINTLSSAIQSLQ